MNDRIPSTVYTSSSAGSKVRVKKLVSSGMLTALTVALSGFSIPVGASKCFPVQHLSNVLAEYF